MLSAYQAVEQSAQCNLHRRRHNATDPDSNKRAETMGTIARGHVKRPFDVPN
jgi:hypothetical protein